MFDLLDQNVRLVNIDESWIPAKDNRYMKWRAPADSNSVAIKILSRRIAILAAIDTRGNVYQSVSQHNSTAQTMRVFITHLVEVLDNEDP